MRAAFRVLSWLCLAVALAACGGDPGPDPTPSASPAVGEPVVAPSEPFSQVVELEWQGPEGQRETLSAWVADTPQKRALGFMGRTELPEEAGMLFVFAADHRGGFWMKNTLIPLSIAYLSGSGEVLAVLDMEPCQADPCPTYDPGTPYRYAVEAGKGWFSDREIVRGWKLAGEIPPASG